jgi:hypothetical protein
MGRWGIVDGSFLCDFFSLAAVLVRPHSLRAGLRVPSRVGGGAYTGAALARKPTAAPGWSRDFLFVFAEYAGGFSNCPLYSTSARSDFSEDSADHIGAGVSCFLVGSL